MTIRRRAYERATLAAPVRLADPETAAFPAVRHGCPDKETGLPRLLPAKAGNTLRSYCARSIGVYQRAFDVAELDAEAAAALDTFEWLAATDAVLRGCATLSRGGLAEASSFERNVADIVQLCEAVHTPEALAAKAVYSAFYTTLRGPFLAQHAEIKAAGVATLLLQAEADEEAGAAKQRDAAGAGSAKKAKKARKREREKRRRAELAARAVAKVAARETMAEANRRARIAEAKKAKKATGAKKKAAARARESAAASPAVSPVGAPPGPAPAPAPPEPAPAPRGPGRLECDICFEAYDEAGAGPRVPRILIACGHTFCEDCIAKIMRPRLAEGGVKPCPCPNCREVTAVPGGRAAELPVNVALYDFM